MKDWVKKRIMELNANNIIIFPLRDEDVERRRRNAEIDKAPIIPHIIVIGMVLYRPPRSVHFVFPVM